MRKVATAAKYSVETPAKLLRAAIGVFAEFGYEGASTREISRRAGANQSQITYHFGSKEKLWKAVVELINADFQAAVAASLDDPELQAVDPLRRIVESYLRFSWRNPEWPILIVQAGMSSESRVAWMFDTVVRPMMTRVMDDIVSSQVLDRANPDRMQALSLFSMLGGSALVFISKEQNRRMFSIDTETDAYFAAHVDVVYTAFKAVIGEGKVGPAS